jgi:hypothetical protein
MVSPNFPTIESSLIRKRARPDSRSSSKSVQEGRTSGNSCEARIHHAMVTLPVAKTVALQASPGDIVNITSDTNQRISRIIVIVVSSEGHLEPIN